MRKAENPGDPWHFPRPELAEAYLSAFALGLTSARGLFARRRMGKTEFLCKDLLPAAVAQDYLVAYTNLWDTETPDIALVSALAEALEPRGWMAVLTALGKPVKKVKASAKVPGAEGSIEAELAQLDTDSSVTLRDMFARSSEPFYNWAPLEPFPLLGDEYVAFTITRVKSMARRALTLAQGKQAFDALHRTPDFFKRFVERFMMYQPQGAEAALEYTLNTVFSDEQFVRQWDAANPADQGVLALLAEGESDLHSVHGLERLSALIGKAATRNTAGHALRRLQDANVVTRLSLGRYRIEDEAFAEWIRRTGEAPR